MTNVEVLLSGAWDYCITTTATVVIITSFIALYYGHTSGHVKADTSALGKTSTSVSLHVLFRYRMRFIASIPRLLPFYYKNCGFCKGKHVLLWQHCEVDEMLPEKNDLVAVHSFYASQLRRVDGSGFGQFSCTDIL